MKDSGPISAKLHLGPNSDPSIVVTFPGTYKAFSLTAEQAQRLLSGLERGITILKRDAGERQRSEVFFLIEARDL